MPQPSRISSKDKGVSDKYADRGGGGGAGQGRRGVIKERGG